MNSFFNELLSYFIDMSINTYEEVFNSFPSQAIICTLKNFTDFNNIIIETNLENILDNDITKYLLNSNNYFKKNYLIKINEPEIDIKKVKNKANISISNDEISCLRYISKYEILLVGSFNGKIYCIDIDKQNCFCQIQAHTEDEEKRGNWGIMYIGEIEGNRLITCCEDSTMKLWEIVEKKVKIKILILISSI